MLLIDCNLVLEMFWSFEHLNFGFVSDFMLHGFVLRISNFMVSTGSQFLKNFLRFEGPGDR
jgi:hypothetical protein